MHLIARTGTFAASGVGIAPNNGNKNCQAGPLNLSKNIQTAKQLAHTFWFGSPLAVYNAASQYVGLVQTGGPWDPKTTMGMTPGNVVPGTSTSELPVPSLVATLG